MNIKMLKEFHLFSTVTAKLLSAFFTLICIENGIYALYPNY